MEVVVVHPQRVAGGAAETGPVVVRAAAGDLDGLTGAVLRGRRTGVEAAVPVAVGLAVLVEAMIIGERKEAVRRVPPPHHVVDDEAVGLEDVERELVRVLDAEVAEVDPVRAVCPDHHMTLEPTVDNHVLRRRAGAFDLQVAQPVVARDSRVRTVPEDRDQVLHVRAGHLLLVGDHVRLVDGRTFRRERNQAGPLVVDARLDQNAGTASRHGVDRCLDAAEAVLAAFGEQSLVELAQRLGESGYALRGVRSAHHEIGTTGPVNGHRSRAGGNWAGRSR